MAVTSLLLSLSLFLSSCRPTVGEICEKHLARLEIESAQIASELLAFGEVGRLDRMPASRQPEPGEPYVREPLKDRLDPARREQMDDWISWAEKRLSFAQSAVDVISEDARLRPANRALNDLATLLVTFHGYAQDARVKKMRETLDAMRPKFEAFRASACVTD